MPDKTVEKVRGRVKEAAGALTGDSGLKNRGRAEQAKGSVRKAADKLQESLAARRRARRSR
jgi:uncharacterized protein YjbJ (UPF0337 family)